MYMNLNEHELKMTALFLLTEPELVEIARDLGVCALVLTECTDLLSLSECLHILGEPLPTSSHLVLLYNISMCCFRASDRNWAGICSLPGLLKLSDTGYISYTGRLYWITFKDMHSTSLSNFTTSGSVISNLYPGLKKRDVLRTCHVWSWKLQLDLSKTGR